ncbi:MAG: tRNA (N6-isopentenyl adenosine(37)-C2)-methylthiotransferase MiaB [Acidimicrobiales bacterium]
MATRSYFIRTFGCQMNENDSQRLAGLMEADGLTAAASVETADVVILNTCCIRENADNKLYGNLGQLHSLKAARPQMQIAVGGCLAQKDGDLIRARAPHVDAVFGTHNLGRAAELLAQAAASGPVTEIVEWDQASASPEAPALGARRDLPWSAWVTIQVGCDNACAFCIVPAVRGPEISRDPDDLVAEVRALAAQGVSEITLLGQNVNSYGRDITRRSPLFAGLLRRLGEVEGITRIRYTSPHPKDLRDDTLAAMAEVPAVCEHLHLPLQAGSDRTLAEMHRGYTAARYLDRLSRARAAVADLAVTTDLIVGFPGETEEDFTETLAVVAEARFDSAYTFIFSPRPGTQAAEMVDRFVDPEEMADRFERLRVVVERSAVAANSARVGGVEEVLVEGPSKRSALDATGRTRRNTLVHFPAEVLPRPGSLAQVRINRAAAHHLRAELVEVTTPPRHKTRLPVLA